MVNHIICPKCGTEIPVTTPTANRMGRKPYDIPFTIVCNALKVSSKGKPCYKKAALALEKKTGVRVSPAFVWMRVEREAKARGVSREELLKEILSTDESSNLSES